MQSVNLYTMQDTNALAQHIVKILKNERKFCVCLQGDLGSGKTTIAQEIGKILGVRENIISPTFVLLKEYKTQDENFKILAHADFYRLNSSDELGDLRLDNYLGGKTLLLVEWPNKIGFECRDCVKVKLFFENNKRMAKIF